MKKHFIWLAIGATAMTACTQVDLIEEGTQSNAIGFENVVNKHSRAEVTGDVALKNFDQFSVYGYYTETGKEATPVQVFGGDLVTRPNFETNKWTYEITRYWMPTATYYFYAYSCADIALDSSKGKGNIQFNVSATDGDKDKQINARSLKINDYICNANHQHDLICSSVEGTIGQDKDNENVKFVFKHALCKVSAEFINAFPAGYEIEITDVKIKNFYDKANLNVSDVTWSNQSRTITGETDATTLGMTIEEGQNVATSTANAEGTPVKVNTGSVFMLPVEYSTANVNLEFTLSVKYNNVEMLNRTLVGTWKPEWTYGNAYNYVITITGSTAQLEAIEFEAAQEVTDITDADADGDGYTDQDIHMTFQAK